MFAPQDTQYQSCEYQPYEATTDQDPGMEAPTPYNQKPEQCGKLDTEEPPMGDDNATDIQINQAIRRGFIVKTYGILLSQLLITLCFIFLSFSDTIRDSFRFNSLIHTIILVASLIAVLIILVMFSCCRSTARKTPINYILLFTFTLCMSYYCLLLCSNYDRENVVNALVLTMALTVGLTVYAFKSQTDYTYSGFILFGLVFFLPFVGLCILWSTLSYVIFCIIAGVIIYSMYIVYDTQLILGELGLEYKIDDYILAALNLYIDIIYIFIKLVKLLAICNRGR